MGGILGSWDIDFAVNPVDIADIDFAVSVGGDGTLLDTAHRLISLAGAGAEGAAEHHPPLKAGAELPILLGINTGRLGFLTSAPSDSLLPVFESLMRGDYTIEPRDMITINGTTPALNEFAAQRGGVEMVEVELTIDHTPVARYWGDGVIVSTPTGSTAYSMSVGGAILAPTAGCLIISPMAPHNLSIRPLVVPNTANIDIKIHASSPPLITTDGVQQATSATNHYTIRRAAQQLRLLTHSGGDNFYQKLTEKLNWGTDPRQTTTL